MQPYLQRLESKISPSTYTLEALKPWQSTTTLSDPMWCSRPTRVSPCVFVTSTLCAGAAVQKPNHIHMDSIQQSGAGAPVISTEKCYWQSQFAAGVVRQDQEKRGAHGDWGHPGMSSAAPPWRTSVPIGIESEEAGVADAAGGSKRSRGRGDWCAAGR